MDIKITDSQERIEVIDGETKYIVIRRKTEDGHREQIFKGSGFEYVIGEERDKILDEVNKLYPERV